MRIIKLSVNQDRIRSKEEGGGKTVFCVGTYNLDSPETENQMRNLFRENVHSVNYFTGGINKTLQTLGYSGRAQKSRFAGLWGIALDFDDGKMTLEEAKQTYSKYIHIIYTTSGHRINKPEHGGLADRFRVILPLKPREDGSAYFAGDTAGDELYNYLKLAYPQADPAIFHKAAKLYPFTGTDTSRYKFYLNANGEWFTVSIDEIEQAKEHRQMEKRSANKRTKSEKNFSSNETVMLPDRKTQMYIRDIDVKTTCFCLFCDDINSKTASAFVDLNDHGDHYMYCSHCGKTFWSDTPKFNPKRLNLYFDHAVGHPAFFDDRHMIPKFFKNGKDWRNFCEMYLLNQLCDEKLPRAAMAFDPKKIFGLDQDDQTFNIFQPSEYLKAYEDKIAPDLNVLRNKTPRILSILENVFGDDETIDLFLNWVAFILQARRKSTLAWLITSEARGTGKEVVVKLILEPIFGHKQTQILPGSNMVDRFNSEDANCWLRCYDEVFQAGNTKTNLERREWLKTKIGSSVMFTEPKHMDKIKLDSYINYILLSNSIRAILLERGDRRFNVVRNASAVPLHTGKDWWVDGPTMEKEIESELPVFAQYVQKIRWDYQKANYPTDNEARLELMEQSKDNIQYFVDKLAEGDADFFELEIVYPQIEGPSGLDLNLRTREHYREIIEQKNAIPAVCIRSILRHHFRTSDPLGIKRRLESHGLKKQTIRLDGELTMKAYVAD